MSTFSAHIAAKHEAVSATRQHLDAFLRAECPLIDDRALEAAAIVFTELAANVVDHTDSPTIGVTLHADSEELVLEIRHDGDPESIPPLDAWESFSGGDADPGRGHGLRLIHRLTSSIEIDAADGTAGVRCAIPLS